MSSIVSDRYDTASELANRHRLIVLPVLHDPIMGCCRSDSLPDAHQLLEGNMMMKSGTAERQFDV